jgi:hypothetical protein
MNKSGIAPGSRPPVAEKKPSTKRRGLNLKFIVLAAAAVAVSGCADNQSAYVSPASPTLEPIRRPPAYVSPATLKIISDMNTHLLIYLDNYQQCSLEAFASCTIQPVPPGNHTLRVVQPTGTFWESPYDYAEDELVTCIVAAEDVHCRTDDDAFF